MPPPKHEELTPATLIWLKEEAAREKRDVIIGGILLAVLAIAVIAGVVYFTKPWISPFAWGGVLLGLVGAGLLCMILGGLESHANRLKELERRLDRLEDKWRSN